MRGECFKTEYLTGQQSCHEKQTQTLKTHSSWAFGKKQVLQLTLEMEGEPSSPHRVPFHFHFPHYFLMKFLPSGHSHPLLLVTQGTRQPPCVACLLCAFKCHVNEVFINTIRK